MGNRKGDTVRITQDAASDMYSYDVGLRNNYKSIRQNCCIYGLDHSEICRSVDLFSELKSDNRKYVKVSAYKPTGIALGCPLPDSRFHQKLWIISQIVDGFLLAMKPELEYAFAYVPQEAYHITIVNRTHFDCDLTVTSMSPLEREKTVEVIRQISTHSLSFDFHGLLLTTSGRVLVSGYPCEYNFYHMRENLAESIPELRVNKPETAHIKIGHLLTTLSHNELTMFSDWLLLCGELIKAHLVFYDLYTPQGIIPLKGN